VTVRTPLKYVDVNTLQEMSTDEVTAWVNHICYLYGGSPSVTLTVDTGSAQNLQAMYDTRLQAGAAYSVQLRLFPKPQRQNPAQLQ
jgi:hypothetical protein